MEKKNMRIGKFFSNCAKNKKIHGSGYRNRYATAFTPHNCNHATATITAAATAFQNLALKPIFLHINTRNGFNVQCLLRHRNLRFDRRIDGVSEQDVERAGEGGCSDEGFVEGLRDFE